MRILVHILKLSLVCGIMRGSNIWRVSCFTNLSYYNSNAILIIFRIVFALCNFICVQLSIRFLPCILFFLLRWDTFRGHRHFWRLQVNSIFNLITFPFYSTVYLGRLPIWLIALLITRFLNEVWSTITLFWLWEDGQSAVRVVISVSLSTASVITISHIKRD